MVDKAALAQALEEELQSRPSTASRRNKSAMRNELKEIQENVTEGLVKKPIKLGDPVNGPAAGLDSEQQQEQEDEEKERAMKKQAHWSSAAAVTFPEDNKEEDEQEKEKDRTIKEHLTRRGSAAVTFPEDNKEGDKPTPAPRNVGTEKSQEKKDKAESNTGQKDETSSSTGQKKKESTEATLKPDVTQKKDAPEETTKKSKACNIS